MQALQLQLSGVAAGQWGRRTSTQQQAALPRRRQATGVVCSAAAAETAVKLPTTHAQASAAALAQLSATKGVNRKSP